MLITRLIGENNMSNQFKGNWHELDYLNPDNKNELISIKFWGYAEVDKHLDGDGWVTPKYIYETKYTLECMEVTYFKATQRKAALYSDRIDDWSVDKTEIIYDVNELPSWVKTRFEKQYTSYLKEISFYPEK